MFPCEDPTSWPHPLDANPPHFHRVNCYMSLGSHFTSLSLNNLTSKMRQFQEYLLHYFLLDVPESYLIVDVLWHVEEPMPFPGP